MPDSEEPQAPLTDESDDEFEEQPGYPDPGSETSS